MRLLVVGGSNSLIAGSYLETALERLRGSEDVRLEETLNLSVGSVTCVRGLEALKRFERLAEFDVVVLEYAVNDYVFIEHGAFAMWAAAYEGLIRRVAAAAPKARIVSLLFGRRGAHSGPGQDRRRRRIEALNRRYGADLIDIDAALLSEHGGDRAAFEQLYETSAHYRRPDVTRLVGERVADGLRDILGRGGRTRPARPIAARHFGDAKVIDALQGLAPADPRRTQFENSRFAVEAFSLPLGDSVAFELSGPLIGLSYVSTPHACSVLVEENGVRSLVHTAIGGVKGMSRKVRRFPFLIHNTPATWTKWGWATELDPRRITLTAVTGTGAADAIERPTERRHAMVADAVAPAVHLTALTCYASEAEPSGRGRLIGRIARLLKN